jgi:enamidase
MKVGFGAFTRPTDATSLVSLARSMGFLVMSHSGGASIPGSSPVTVADLLKIKPDIAGHINGGTTSLPDEDLIELIETSEIVLQIVQAGNLRSALFILNEARARGALDRVILGTDTPSGTGVMPLGMIKSVVELASLGDLTPTDAIALATGNAGRILRVQEGVIEIGRPADIVLIQHPLGCARSDPLGAMENGDIPGISGVLIDGEIRALRSRNSPAPAREAAVEAQSSWQRSSD